MSLERIVSQIDSFSKDDHIKILEIIYKYNKSVISENNNGCFINMEDLSEEIITTIEHYINYVILKEGDINKIEDTKDKIKNNINIKNNLL
jgi:hypothetical protein